MSDTDPEPAVHGGGEASRDPVVPGTGPDEAALHEESVDDDGTTAEGYEGDRFDAG